MRLVSTRSGGEMGSVGLRGKSYLKRGYNVLLVARALCVRVRKTINFKRLLTYLTLMERIEKEGTEARQKRG